MSSTVTVYLNNRNPTLADTISVGGSPVNLTGATVTVYVRNASTSALKINGGVVMITNAPLGQVAYSWGSTDLDTAGEYYAWWRVTNGGLTQDTPEWHLLVVDHGQPFANLIVGIEDVKENLRITKNTWDGQLTRMIRAATARFERFTGHTVSVVAATSRDFQYDGSGVLDLMPFDINANGATPVLTMDTDVSAGFTLSPAMYRFEPRPKPFGIYTMLMMMESSIAMRGGLNWWSGGDSPLGTIGFGRQVTVTADWGWTTIPDDIRQGALQQVSQWWANPRQNAQAATAQFTEVVNTKLGQNLGIPDVVAECWRPFLRKQVW